MDGMRIRSVGAELLRLRLAGRWKISGWPRWHDPPAR